MSGLCSTYCWSAPQLVGRRLLRATLPLALGLSLAVALLALLSGGASPVRVAYAAGEVCFATFNDGATVFSSTDASAVQNAVTAALTGSVKVAGICAGVQLTGGATQTVYISQTLTLAGGYTATDWVNSYPLTQPTTLDAQSGGRVIVISGVNGDISNLTVQNGNVTGGGGGITTTAALTLTNVNVLSNTASANGGGIYAAGAVTLNGGLFQNNTSSASGGGLYAFNSLTLTGTQFLNNTSNNGGGLFANTTQTTQTGGSGGFPDVTVNVSVNAGDSVTATATNGAPNTINVFITFPDGSTVGGVGVDSASGTASSAGTATVQFHSNLLPNFTYTITVCCGGTARVVNALFARNTAITNGAALYLNSGGVEIVHTTIASPTLTSGAAIYVTTGTVGITNTIVASHTIGINRTGGTVPENYNLFSGVTTPYSGTIISGGNSLTGTAAFVNAANGDYHLTSASVAIDAGTNLSVTTDLDGATRPQGSASDIGAYEFVPVGVAISKIASSDPLTAGTNISYTLLVTNTGSLTDTNVTFTDTLPLSLTVSNLDQTDDSTAEFNSGTFNNTQWYAPRQWLEVSPNLNATGVFTSRVMDAGSDAVWDSLDWVTRRPADKEFPDNNGAETAYARGNVDMAGNRILLHLNDKNGATVFNDASGNGLDGGCGAACPTAGNAGRFNTALTFDDSLAQTVVISDTFDPGDFTLEAWVNVSVVTDSALILRTDSLSGPQTNYSHLLGLAGGQFIFTLSNGATQTLTSTLTTITGTTSVVAGQWYHVGAVYNNGRMVLYVNGNAESATNASGPPWVGGDEWVLGSGYGYSPTVGNYFNGVLDEAAIYTRALSSNEIRDHYLRGALHLQIQIRSCDDSACVGETFIGPDDTAATYYSETGNNTVGLPSFTGIVLPNNRYFQYQVTLATDDAYYSPELTSVSIGGAHPDVTIIPTQGTCSFPSANVLACSLGSLGPTSTVTVTVNGFLNASAPTTITNTATVTTTSYDSIISNNTVTLTTAVTRTADLSINKYDASITNLINPRGLITYGLDVYNGGPSTAYTVTVTDTLPISVTFSRVITNGWTCSQVSRTVTCTLPSLLPYNYANTLGLVVTAPITNGLVVNTGYVSSNAPDNNPLNDTDTTTTTVTPLADLSLVKSASVNPVDPGGTLVYTLSVANAGPNDALTVTVTDTLPSAATYVGASASGWTCGQASGVVTCAVSALSSTTTSNIVITVTAPFTGLLANTANMASGLTDPDPTNNADALITVVKPLADLTLSKDDSPDPVYVGQPLTYTVTITNNGPTSAGIFTTSLNYGNGGNVTINDNSPANPYPSSINIRGLVGAIQTLTVTLSGLTHNYPADISALLEGPGGQTVLLMSSAGNNQAITQSATLTFTALAGAPSLPEFTLITSGVYLPTSYNVNPIFGGAAPTGPYGSSLAAFNNTDPNGTWHLWVVDEETGFSGAIANGWSLALDVEAQGVVTLTDSLPLAVTAPAVSAPAGWACQTTNSITCTINSLAANASQIFTVTVTAPLTGSVITNTATLTSTTLDFTPNNTTTITTTVLAAPTLTVNLTGTGTGVVTSLPAGINCGGTCAANFNHGTVVTLTAAPSSGSTFSGWSGGGCGGAGNCLVTLNSAQTVTAQFNTSQLFVMMPLIMKSRQPGVDLVGSFSLNPGGPSFSASTPVTVSVTITNQGADPATIPFWVDFYLNPNPVPTTANRVWDKTCTLTPCEGISWYYTGTLASGQSVTVSSAPNSIYISNTIWSGVFPAGTTDLYLYVDSYSDDGSPNGALLENTETNNRFELHGLTVSTPAPGESLPAPTDPRTPADLPSRREAR